MTKNFCDRCGVELSEAVGQIANVTVQFSYTSNANKWELCLLCWDAVDQSIQPVTQNG